MDPITNIIIVEGAHESLIAKVFNGSSIPLSVTNDAKHADLLTAQMNNPLIFIELDDDCPESRGVLANLIESINLPLFQLIILGSKRINPELKEKLKRTYKDLNFLDFDRHDFEDGDIAALIKKSFSDIYQDQEYTDNLIKKTQRASSTITVPIVTLKKADEKIGTYDHRQNILNQFLSQEGGLRTKKYLNGDIYIQVREPSSLLDKDYLPELAAYRSAIEKLEKECTNWERSHFHRTAFVSYNILQSLHLEQNLVDLARATSFLYSFPTAVSNESLTRSQYIRGSQSATKKSIISSLRANATSFGEQKDLKDIAPIIATIANVLEGICSLPNPTHLSEINANKIASTIVLADLIDRECWQDSYWDSNAGYSVIQWMESAAGKNLDSDVVWECMRFLVETFEATPPEHMITKRHRKELIQFPSSKREKINDKNTHKISQLTPGMRLSEPLITFDGKHILDNDTRLDQNLIWRIWRLCALYPIEPAQIAG